MSRWLLLPVLVLVLLGPAAVGLDRGELVVAGLVGVGALHDGSLVQSVLRSVMGFCNVVLVPRLIWTRNGRECNVDRWDMS